MNELEIIYYYVRKTNEIIPFIKDENNHNKIIVDKLIKGLDASYKDFFVLYFIDLLKNGYSFNYIKEFLKKEISKKEEDGNFRYVKPLMELNDALEKADLLLNEDENTKGLVEFYTLPSIQSSIRASKKLKNSRL